MNARPDKDEPVVFCCAISTARGNRQDVMKPKYIASKLTRFRCVVCGNLSAGRVPTGGDGTARYPRRHKTKGTGFDCPGIYHEADGLREAGTPAALR